AATLSVACTFTIFVLGWISRLELESVEGAVCVTRLAHPVSNARRGVSDTAVWQDAQGAEPASVCCTRRRWLLHTDESASSVTANNTAASSRSRPPVHRASLCTRDSLPPKLYCAADARRALLRLLALSTCFGDSARRAVTSVTFVLPVSSLL